MDRYDVQCDARKKERMNENRKYQARRLSKPFLTPACFGIIFLLLCSLLCAVVAQAASSSSACLGMNADAGRGNWLIAMIKFQGGEELPFIIDTGWAVSVLDDSLKARLGEPLGASTVWNFGKSNVTYIYAAPKLFAGNKLLKMRGTNVCTYNCKSIASANGRPVMGILGMDVMINYCLQLDFQKREICFSDRLGTNENGLGQAFDLFDVGDGCFSVKENFTGVSGPGSLIDTGCNYDGWLVPKLFEIWTNHANLPPKGEVRSPQGVLGRETYSGLDLHRLGEGLAEKDTHMNFNGIGLTVLAQNLVTFDFPRRIMYLKRTGDWRPPGKNNEETAKAAGESAAEFLKELHERDRLPGWSKIEEGGTTAFHFDKHAVETITLDLEKTGDSNVYHYTLTRPLNGDDNSWTLARAWQTDQNNQKTEEYPVR